MSEPYISVACALFRSQSYLWATCRIGVCLPCFFPFLDKSVCFLFYETCQLTKTEKMSQKGEKYNHESGTVITIIHDIR